MFFFFSSRRRHTRYWRDWSSDVCSSDLATRDRTGCRRSARARKTTRDASPDSFGAAPAPRSGSPEIGRSAFRERVYISVVAVSLKKKEVGEGGCEYYLEHRSVSL